MKNAGVAEAFEGEIAMIRVDSDFATFQQEAEFCKYFDN